MSFAAVSTSASSFTSWMSSFTLLALPDAQDARPIKLPPIATSTVNTAEPSMFAPSRTPTVAVKTFPLAVHWKNMLRR